MRSSKSRSRSKSNRQRSPMGNIINRVFDSSGPESKVRGTPQQIIDKYLMLARDAQLGNDRVAAENFLQHAEHYARMLSEAQREMEAQRQNQGQQGGGDQQQPRGGQDDGERGGERDDNRGDYRAENRGERRPDNRGERRQGEQRDEQRDEPRHGRRPDRAATEVIDIEGEEGPDLVDTPEARRSEQPGAEVAAPAQDSQVQDDAGADNAAPDRPARPRRERRPRGPRPSDPPSEAAE